MYITYLITEIEGIADSVGQVADFDALAPDSLERLLISCPKPVVSGLDLLDI